jgi:hypothetical protein
LHVVIDWSLDISGSSSRSIACSVAGRWRSRASRRVFDVTLGSEEDHIHVNMLHVASSGMCTSIADQNPKQDPVSFRYKPTNQSERSALPELPSSQLGNHSTWPTRNYSVSTSFLLSSVLIHHLNALPTLLYSTARGKVQELQVELQQADRKDKSYAKKKIALKKIVANMTMGNDSKSS